VGVYINAANRVPLGAMMNKVLTFTSGRTHVQRYAPFLLSKIDAGDFDPSFVVIHRLSLKDGRAAYETIRGIAYGCIRLVLKA
jgi:threonine dehydrogenase-like Zn-dependent dehydrogenase